MPALTTKPFFDFFSIGRSFGRSEINMRSRLRSEEAYLAFRVRVRRQRFLFLIKFLAEAQERQQEAISENFPPKIYLNFPQVRWLSRPSLGKSINSLRRRELMILVIYRGRRANEWTSFEVEGVGKL